MRARIRPMIALGAAAAAIAALALPAAEATAAPATTPTVHYYLALGDSLAQGFQPNANGIGIDTDQGYVDDIFANQLLSDPTLQVVKLGCPGETTNTFLYGGICPQYISQMKSAVRFLKRYGAETSFVTLDIGANNVDNCVGPTGVINLPCLVDGEKQAGKQLPNILHQLQAADPGVKIYAMNYYDPFLAAYLAGNPGLATASITLSEQFNTELDNIYAAYNVPVADVFDTPFATTDTTFADGYTIGDTAVPDNVGLLCALTYNCTPAPVGPNIHANAAGYQGIANAFLPLINGTVTS